MHESDSDESVSHDHEKPNGAAIGQVTEREPVASEEDSAKRRALRDWLK